MTTISLNDPAQWTEQSKSQLLNTNIWKRFLALADGQSKNRTLWFVVSLIVQGVLFLPVPAVVIYYYNAPVMLLAITLTLFFANIIAGMTSAGIRTLLSILVLSVLIHVIMLAVFII